MRGNNQFYLNQSTVVEALQEYFDKRLTPKVEVKSVNQQTGSQSNEQGSFKVEVSEPATSGTG